MVRQAGCPGYRGYSWAFEKCLGGNEEPKITKGIQARLHLGSERFVIIIWSSSSTPKYTLGDLKTYFHTETHTWILIAA